MWTLARRIKVVPLRRSWRRRAVAVTTFAPSKPAVEAVTKIVTEDPSVSDGVFSKKNCSAGTPNTTRGVVPRSVSLVVLDIFGYLISHEIIPSGIFSNKD